MTLSAISPEMVDELRQTIGESAVTSDPDKLQSFASDESKLVYPPELVVEPTSTDQVRDTMLWASKHRIPVTPRAAGSNVTGGALAIQGGVILSLMKMNRILEIDEGNLIAVVEPGIITLDFQRAVEAQGLYYPPDPSSIDTSTVGGNVAENAGGPHCLKYGTTKDYVLGLTVVLPSGDILRTGMKTRKGVVGYDLTPIFIGSEGTLGVLTEIVLRLLPRPQKVATLLAFFQTLESATSAVAGILGRGIIPAAAELIPVKSLDLLTDKFPFALPKNVQALLLIELDGHPQAVTSERNEVGDVCFQAKAIDVVVAEGEAKRKTLWDVRRNIWTTLVEKKPLVESLDIVVPIRRITEYVNKVAEIESRYGINIHCLGHAGDGNIHTDIAMDVDTPELREKIRQASLEIMSLAISMGGTIAGEHGIGLTKKEFVTMELSPTSIALQKNLKRLFDPLNIMNPGKVLP
jgi:glycolate oxidase subunit GlcD